MERHDHVLGKGRLVVRLLGLIATLCAVTRLLPAAGFVAEGACSPGAWGRDRCGATLAEGRGAVGTRYPESRILRQSRRPLDETG